jgi:single-strand DNA-binding protein
VAGQYIRKGNEVAVEGKLVLKVYETSAGEKRYVTEINVKEILMLKGRQE